MKDSASRRFAASLIAGLPLLTFLPAGWVGAEPAAPYAACVPADKKLDPKWVESLTARGRRKTYTGDELKYLAMPCGGIGAGELSIRGDGNLATWCILNEVQFGNYTGEHYLHPRVEDKRLEHGFAISVRPTGQPVRVLRLNGADFDDIHFIGEYPIASLEYRRRAQDLPVAIQSEVFSPFVPLSVRDSANPVTVLSYTVTNVSKKPVEVALAGWLENFAMPGERVICHPGGSFGGFTCDCIKLPRAYAAARRNRLVKGNGLTSVLLEVQEPPAGGPVDAAQPPAPLDRAHPHFGDLSLSLMEGKATGSAVWTSAEDFLRAWRDGNVPRAESRDYPLASRPCGTVASAPRTLAPGQSGTFTFLVSWHFPNAFNRSVGCPGRVGHIYNNWYTNSRDAAAWVAANFERLSGQTHQFRDAYFDTTLPYWLVQRIGMPASTLAADNIVIWENGRMYGFEGVAFCFGTCGHVYNFAAAISRLFPELERSVRLMQDLGVSFDADSGRVNFRGHDGPNPTAAHAYASDAQSGYVLKLYREHLMSPDRRFLDEVWPKVKRIIGYHIFLDGAERGLEPNGVLEGLQTFWDPMWYGPNPYNNTLYLAALRAAEEMARIQGETTLADRYHGIYENGRKYMCEEMWNGEYFAHLYPEGFTRVDTDNGLVSAAGEQGNAKRYIDAFNSGLPAYYRGGACDANQLFGQNWANQLGLGYILPPDRCRIAARSIFLYNWTPDISTVYNLYPPHNRTLAAPGEGALVNGSWPKVKRQPFENIHDKEDVWTGLEYEAACDMLNEGLLQEGLTVVRAIHDRYDGAKRNPWNEIEGWDHYSRSMHAWNVLLALSGYTYDGPAGKIGFAPRITPEDFRCFFSASEGWGSSFAQRVEGRGQKARIAVKFGQVRLKEISLAAVGGKAPEAVTVMLDGQPLASSFEFRDGKTVLILAAPVLIPAGRICALKWEGDGPVETSQKQSEEEQTPQE